MTVHIREFVLRLGVDGDSPSGDDSSRQEEDGGEALTRSDLEELREEMMEYCQQLVGGSGAPPFDR